jgi:hypothetical protein
MTENPVKVHALTHETARYFEKQFSGGVAVPSRSASCLGATLSADADVPIAFNRIFHTLATTLRRARAVGKA